MSVNCPRTQGCFFVNDPAPTEIYTLPLHDALPIYSAWLPSQSYRTWSIGRYPCCQINFGNRSEEHTSELQSRVDLVCRLLLEKKNIEEDIASGRVDTPIAGVVRALSHAL